MRLLSLLLFMTLLNTGIVKAEEVIGKAIIVDGDTIEINKMKIRLYGIDAPEAGQKCKRKTVAVGLVGMKQ